jgi:hypothetical protein
MGSYAPARAHAFQTGHTVRSVNVTRGSEAETAQLSAREVLPALVRSVGSAKRTGRAHAKAGGGVRIVRLSALGQIFSRATCAGNARARLCVNATPFTGVRPANTGAQM